MTPEIKAWILDVERGKKVRPLFIFGPAGSGKTILGQAIASCFADSKIISCSNFTENTILEIVEESHGSLIIFDSVFTESQIPCAIIEGYSRRALFKSTSISTPPYSGPIVFIDYDAPPYDLARRCLVIELKESPERLTEIEFRLQFKKYVYG